MAASSSAATRTIWAAGRLFSQIGMGDIAAHPPLEAAILRAYVEGERAWIAEVENRVAAPTSNRYRSTRRMAGKD